MTVVYVPKGDLKHWGNSTYLEVVRDLWRRGTGAPPPRSRIEPSKRLLAVSRWVAHGPLLVIGTGADQSP